MFEFKYEGVEMEEQNKMIELKDVELVKKWMIEFLEERLEDVEGFSMGFQRITEEHSDLSMADYKEFLDLIMERVPAELLTEYKKFYAELLSKRKRKMVCKSTCLFFLKINRTRCLPFTRNEINRRSNWL